MTAGVVRVDDTVRRPGSDASGFTAALLGLLAEQGFSAAPKYLGQDERGRDILTYLDGWVPARFQRWSDDQIAAAGALLRAFHDATAGSALAGDSPVVCHHDAAPNNFVFDQDIPAAIIDFDLAAPGDPLEDVGYAAWTWCIASKHADPDRQAHQVRVLADAYGLTLEQRRALIPATQSSQLRNAIFWSETPCDPAAAAERIAWSHREHDFIAANRRTFEAALAGATGVQPS
jgi:aminoglycoside phosphotransferase (APT) family kinase protein